MASSVIFALLTSSLASPSLAWLSPSAPLTAFLTITSTRQHRPMTLSQRTSRECSKRGSFIAPLCRDPDADMGTRQDPPPLFTSRSDGRQIDPIAVCIEELDAPEEDILRSKGDSPAAIGQELQGSASDAATIAAVAMAMAIYLAPLDAAATITSTTTTGVELIAQAAGSLDVGAILSKAGKASLGGGASGASAAVIQVLSLMWLRTTMNFQYKNGGSTQDALRTLWEEGGVPRLYRGVSFALVQGPLSRFGDTAANVGVLALLESFESTRSLPLPVKSAAGSVAAGLWRIGLTPIDAYKTTLQVSGPEGTKLLAEKVAANGPGVLFEGALATATATFVGHYPWYFTYNSLGAWLPTAPAGEPLLKLARQAFLGLCSSCVSDCCSNSIRVIKTTKQTAPVPISYPEALKQVVDEDGVAGLFVRGLQTRILVNALQGALFAVAWKYFEELIRTSGALQ